MSMQDSKGKMTKQGVRDLDFKVPKKRLPVATAEGIVDPALPLPLVAVTPAVASPPSLS